MSTTEAVSAGVPIVGLPIFGDQETNMRHVTHFQYGMSLDHRNITEEILYTTIAEVLYNPK